MKEASFRKALKHGTLEQLARIMRSWDLKPVHEDKTRLFITPNCLGEDWNADFDGAEKRGYQARLHKLAAAFNVHLINAFDAFHQEFVGDTPTFVHGSFGKEHPEHAEMPFYKLEYDKSKNPGAEAWVKRLLQKFWDE